MAVDYVALAKQFGGQVDEAPAQQPGDSGDVDYASLAAQFGGQVEQQQEPQTTAAGVTGAVIRGLALPAAGAAIGAAAGLPFAGVGAIPLAIAGAGAGALTQFVGDPIVGAVNSMFGTKYRMPTEAMEDLLTRIGVPEARTEAERIVQTAASAAGSAGGLAAAGKAVQMAARASMPVTREVGRALASQPGAQVAGGAAAGAAAQAAKEMELGTAAEIGAGLAGGVLGARAAMPRSAAAIKKPLPPEIAQADREGIKLMTSDIRPPKTFIEKSLRSAGEKIPYAGTGGIRQQQQEQRIQAIRNVLNEYGAEDAAKLSDDVLKDLSTKRSSDLKKYSSIKNDVVNRLADKGIVPVPNAIKAIDDQIDDLAKRRTEGADEAIESLQKIKSDLKDRDLFQLEAYRKDELAKIFKDDPARPMSLAAREAGEKALRAIYDPVRKDMGDFIKSVGERKDFEKWAIANKRLAETSGDMQNASLKTLLIKGDVTPEVMQRILFKGKKSEVQALYSKLTPDGRANARSAILARAFQDSLTDQKNISPEKFANSIKKMEDSLGVMFKGKEKERVDGLVRVLNLTRRASEAAVHPATGVQAIPFLALDVLTSTLGGPMGATAGAATVGGISRIYESAAIRNLLLQINRTKKGSKEEAALAKRLIAAIQTQSEIEKQKKTKSKKHFD